MNSFLESLVVGLFSLKIAFSLYLFNLKKNIYVFFFLTGFLKHFLGYYTGLQTYYCNYGNACVEVLEKKDETNHYQIKHMESFVILLESFFEGWAFVSLGVLISKMIKKREILICLLIGFVLHLLFEILHVHESFCKKRCVKNKSNSFIFRKN